MKPAVKEGRILPVTEIASGHQGALELPALPRNGDFSAHHGVFSFQLPSFPARKAGIPSIPLVSFIR